MFFLKNTHILLSPEHYGGVTILVFVIAALDTRQACISRASFACVTHIRPGLDMCQTRVSHVSHLGQAHVRRTSIIQLRFCLTLSMSKGANMHLILMLTKSSSIERVKSASESTWYLIYENTINFCLSRHHWSENFLINK